MMKPIRIIGGTLLATLTAVAVTTAPVPAFAGGQKFCPPGLAKKNNHCTPPGQLKKWTKGRSLPQDVTYRPLSNWSDYDLEPPDDGYVYGSVDGDILLIRAATRLVVDAVILAAFID